MKDRTELPSAKGPESPGIYVKRRFLDRKLFLTLSRVEVHNALDGEACAELGRVLDAAEADDAIRVIIISGEGDKAFCAGFDLAYAESHPEVYRNRAFGSEIVRRPVSTKPLIAAVNGLALGLGFELALACDLLVAAKHARFALPEPTVGLAAMGGGVVRLCRQIGLKRALGITLTSRLVSAQEGLELGFVNEVTEHSVIDAASRWADQIIRGAPLSITATLEMAYRGVDITELSSALDPRAYATTMAVLASEDAQEGRKAFLQKRPPIWGNR